MSQSPLAQSGSAVIARRHTFAAAHRYNQKKFSDDKNRVIFGACFNQNGHGHNYTVEAFVEGTISDENGLIADVVHIETILKEVCGPLDHHHLNLDVPEFAETIPTTENLALYLFTKIQERLHARLPQLSLHRVRLFETDDLWSEVWA